MTAVVAAAVTNSNGKGLTSHFGSAGTLKLVKSVCLNASCLKLKHFVYLVVIVQVEMSEWVSHFKIATTNQKNAENFSTKALLVR